ncbi:MAG: ATP-binding protein, partial [Candidatus Aenigmatarchaeota archaeon]
MPSNGAPYPNTQHLLRLLNQEEMSDQETRKLVLAAGLSRNEHLQSSASKAILGKSVQHWRYPFNQETPFGEIRVGETFKDRSFFLSQEDLVKHLLAVGQSGSGKTTLFYCLMNQTEKPFWAFDLKQDYRHLAQDIDLLVL